MSVVNDILYFRRAAIAWKYPDLKHGPDEDFQVSNMDRNPKSETYGQEKIEWNTKLYPQPSEEEMLEWYDQFKYLLVRKYPDIKDQLDMLYWDKVNGTNNWQESIKAVKLKYPKPEKTQEI